MSSSNCLHDTTWGGLCVECGADVSKANNEEEADGATAAPPIPTSTTTSSATMPTDTTEADSKTFSILHGDSALKVSEREALRIHRETTAELQRSGKLILVLDLDNTLIHATTSHELQDASNIIGQNIEYPDETDIYQFALPPSPLTYWVKLRPMVREFLDELSGKFQLNMYTHGSRQYAHQVTKILDPNDTLFGGRILSRDDCNNAMEKTLKRLFPIDDSMAVIIDDRSDVWAGAENLIQIHPFKFFPVRHELNALPGDQDESVQETRSHAATLATEANRDRHLIHVRTLLVNLHEDYFARLRDETRKRAPDLKHLLMRRRRRLFRGLTFVFTGVFPQEHARKRREALQLAMKHGANFQDEIDERVTHVLAGIDNTAKVHMASKREGVYLVRADWFYDSIERVERQAEADYALGERPVFVGRPPEIVMGDEEATSDSHSARRDGERMYDAERGEADESSDLSDSDDDDDAELSAAGASARVLEEDDEEERAGSDAPALKRRRTDLDGGDGGASMRREDSVVLDSNLLEFEAMLAAELDVE